MCSIELCSMFWMLIKIAVTQLLVPIIELWTGTQNYRNTSEVTLISEPAWSFYIQYSFRYVFAKKHPKNARNLCLLWWTVLKTWLLTSEQHISTLAQVRDCHNAHIFKRFPVEKMLRKPSRRHLPNKTMFLL